MASIDALVSLLLEMFAGSRSETEWLDQAFTDTSPATRRLLQGLGLGASQLISMFTASLLSNSSGICTILKTKTWNTASLTTTVTTACPTRRQQGSK